LMATSWMTWSSGGVDRSIGRVDSGTSSTTSTASCSRPAPVPGRSLGQSPGDDHTSPVRPQPEPLPGRSLGQSPGDDHTPTNADHTRLCPAAAWGSAQRTSWPAWKPCP